MPYDEAIGSLKAEVRNLRETAHNFSKRFDSLDKKIESILQWQWKIMGFIAGITFLAEVIKPLFGK